MKIATLFVSTLASVSAFTPASVSTRPNTALAAETATEQVPLANGAMGFNRVCREWRCKYDGDADTSESLEAICKVVDEYLPELKKLVGVVVNRMVCGGCLDFKLQTTVPLEQFGPWEESGHAPEAEFLEKIKAIKGVSQVETQTITKMEI